MRLLRTSSALCAASAAAILLTRGQFVGDAMVTAALLAVIAAPVAWLASLARRRFRQFVEATEQARIGLLICDADDRIRWANSTFRRMTGLANQDIIGRHWETLPGVEVVDPGAKHGVTAARRARLPYDVEALGRSAGGVQRQLRFEAAPSCDRNGDPFQYVTSVTDLTPTRLAAAALRENEQRLRDVVASGGQFVWEVDANYRVTFVTNEVEQVLGYTPAYLISKSPFEFLWEGDCDQARRQLTASKNSGEPFRGLCHRWVISPTDIRWIRVNGAPFYSDDGQFLGFRGACSDVTEQVKREQDLFALGAAIEASADAIFITDKDGAIRHVNSAFTEMTGYSAEEALGENPRMLSAGRMSADFWKPVWQMLSAGKRWAGRFQNCRKSTPRLRILGAPMQVENYYWVDATISPVMDQQGNLLAYIAVERDVTEEVREAEQAQFAREAAETRAIVARLLHEDRPFPERVKDVLAAICRIDYLHVQHRGCVFLKDADADELGLFATHGDFSEEFLSAEQVIPLGHCHCGRAAQSGELVIVDDCAGDAHDGIGDTPHGHYIVPLIHLGDCLGVLVLYTAPFPRRDTIRLAMLRQVGEAIAMAVAAERAHEELLAARAAAEAASRSKTEFLANMSHEIRTPMTAILGFADVLRDAQDGELSSTRRRELIEIIRRNGEHLLAIINDILDISKVEAGRMTVEQIDTHPTRILAEVMSLMQVRAAGKGLRLTASLRTRIPTTIRSDPVRLRQILMNLVGNAIKFTETGSVRLDVAVVDHDDSPPHIEFAIIDTGIGMSADQVKRLFAPFSQADSSMTRRFGGSGLGLLISKRLAELLGGSIEVESQRGRGSVFRASVAMGPLQQAEWVEPQQFGALLEHARATHLQRGKVAASDDAPLAGVRILLAEDGPDNQRLISFCLRKFGAEVVIVPDGREAVAAVKDATSHRKPFALVLMDMQMPVMDGYSATRELRRLGHRLPILALTAHAMAGDRERCLEAGCDDYATKPIDRKRLLQICVDMIRGYCDINHPHG